MGDAEKPVGFSYGNLCGKSDTASLDWLVQLSQRGRLYNRQQLQEAWVSSHNIFSAVWAGVLRGIEDWITWMGYFTSNFLMAVPPSSFGERYYVLTVFIMLAMLSFSTAYLLRTIFVRVFKADRYISRCAVMAMLFYHGTMYGGPGGGVLLVLRRGKLYVCPRHVSVFYGLLISIACDRGKSGKLKLVMVSLLGFLTGGGNQLTALNVAIVLSVAAGFYLP